MQKKILWSLIVLSFVAHLPLGASHSTVSRKRKTSIQSGVDSGWFLNQRIDTRVQDKNLWTLLHAAAERGKVEVVDTLIKAGVDKEARTLGGNTALHIAAKYGQVAFVEKLIELWAHKEAITISGRTPLHLAIEHNKRNVVKVLLDSGANRRAIDGSGRTPIRYALECDNIKIASLLLNCDADNQLRREVENFKRTLVNMSDDQLEHEVEGCKGIIVKASNERELTLRIDVAAVRKACMLYKKRYNEIGAVLLHKIIDQNLFHLILEYDPILPLPMGLQLVEYVIAKNLKNEQSLEKTKR